jgi:hypothetical protein
MPTTNRLAAAVRREEAAAQCPIVPDLGFRQTAKTTNSTVAVVALVTWTIALLNSGEERETEITVNR